MEIVLRGILKAHANWVTSIATPSEGASDPNMILSASRDKSIIVWNITRDENYGVPRKVLKGHSHFVQDVVMSSDGMYALSGSWDGTLRLWDLNYGTTTTIFVGHTADVLSVAFSADNRQIVSGSRDKTIKLWNTLGECKFTITEGGHTEWVSCVKFSPSQERNSVIVSGGWDKTVKVWTSNRLTLKNNLQSHTGYVNAVVVSPDGAFCASGGKDGQAIIWDLDKGTVLMSYDAGDIIHCLCFSPNRYWLCAGTQTSIRIWDLDTKQVVTDLNKSSPDFYLHSKTTTVPACLSLAWNSTGTTLYAGYSDGLIRVWEVAREANVRVQDMSFQRPGEN